MRPCANCQGSTFVDGACERCGRPLLPDRDYFDAIETLAMHVVHRAYDEIEGFSLGSSDVGPPLQRAIAELGGRLRHYHYDGDGCLDD